MFIQFRKGLGLCSMQINKHSSFYIRNGWPAKIIDAIQQDNHIYSPNNELNAVDVIGVGRVMIKAMRYWAVALGIAEEAKDQQGICHNLTPLGNIIANNDIYCTDIGTLWLLHRNLAINIDEATAWSWAFSYFPDGNFQKESFVNAFNAFLQREGASYALKAIEKEFDCFKNTYVSEQVFSLSKIIDEDTIPFFAPLHLIKYNGKGHFEKAKISGHQIPDDIFMYCILLDNKNHLAENRQISINTLLEGPYQVGRYMNLNFSVLLELLQHLENAGFIRLVNNFGNRYIEVLNMNAEEILKEHYHRIGRK